MPVRETRWRVSILISRHRYYANRCSNPLPYVSWKEFSDEYPDHFSETEANLIADYYNDQKPTIDRVVLVLED
mgnify:CR=1 FL=1